MSFFELIKSYKMVLVDIISKIAFEEIIFIADNNVKLFVDCKNVHFFTENKMNNLQEFFKHLIIPHLEL